jgi:hypothetical protein
VSAAPAARKRAPTSFGSVLAEVESGSGDPERIARPLGYPFAAVDPPTEAEDGQPTGAWDQAFAWVEAAGEPPQVEPLRAAPPPVEPAAPHVEPVAPLTDDPEAIAAELGLSDAPTLADLSRARRRFMWANHPDRRPDAPGELANRRVAIANMLLDRAEAALAADRRRG